MNKIYVWIIMFFAALTAEALPTGHRINGVPVDFARYQIVIPANSNRIEEKAGEELQKYLGLITGIRIPVVSELAKMKPGEFIIGLTNRTPDPFEIRELDPDGFLISTIGPKVFIAGGNDKGVLYGVYHLLEHYLGCRFWAPDAETVPRSDSVSIPSIDIREQPAFEIREVYYATRYPAEEDFCDKMRSDHFDWKNSQKHSPWVHSMFSFIPPEVWFESHPEYFAEMGGKRAKTQLCLTNPEVLDMVVRTLRERMEMEPLRQVWDVSQMDTYGACECDQCQKIDKAEGSSAGTMISFVNQVAAEFPGKVISTLAYQYTRKAPKHIRPAPNVKVVLCTIECDRSKPLENDSTPGSFLQDLKEWSAISQNIHIWDYVIQFTNMIAPFPNLPVLKPNITLFSKYNVTSVFEQGCRGTYGENKELRRYMLSKLLWNPAVKADSVREQFLTGYYGAAGTYIGEYLSQMEKNLVATGERLWIYSSPMEETRSFLAPEMVSAYNKLFDQAELAVLTDPVLADRVRKARLPLRYAIIEIAKKNITGADGFLQPDDNGMKTRPEMITTLHQFTEQANRFGVATVAEKNLPPDDYCTKTLDFFKRAWSDHLAKGKSYSLDIQPSVKYLAEGEHSLTDGKRGSANYFVLWQGFEGVDFTATIDLGQPVRFNYAGAGFLQDQASWIFYPERMVVSASSDGKNYSRVASFDSLSGDIPADIKEAGGKFPAVTARYVRFEVIAGKVCPDWHIGHGGKSWVFVDEMVVDMKK